MSQITRADLEARHDFATSRSQVLAAMEEAFATREGRLRFLGRYTSWNGHFGSAVASLAGKIGRSRHLFLDPDQPVTAVADRSVYVASYFFDAARDEFDDRDTVHRDTHRCLAQAVLQGVLDYDAQHDRAWTTEQANTALAVPIWLRALESRVAHGYGAFGDTSDVEVFHAMGYHLGSEVLADEEFSLIDARLREAAPELVAFLEDHDVPIAGQDHNAYTWISIHSGHGGGVEADHFDWAVGGVIRALRYTPSERRDALRERALEGFDAFARDHARFFGRVNDA
ncbi:MAG: hypothetical protein KTR31_21470 [Myxococcales bacterium]|nr:hypothetical protein [Myxococcales bacterium]